MRGGPGGLPQDDLHPLDVRGHLRRDPEEAGIGVGGGEGAHPHQLVGEGHHRVLQEDGDQLEKAVGGEVDIAGEAGPHLLGIDVQAHVVVDVSDQLREGVRPQGGVHAEPDSEDEVAEGGGGEPAPEIDGNGQSRGPGTAGALDLLILQDRLEEHCGEVFGDGGAVPGGDLLQPVHGQKAHGDIQGVEGLRLAGVGESGLLPAVPQDPLARVPGVGILQLLRTRGIIHVQQAGAAGDGVSQLPEVDRQQGAEKGEGPRPVRHSVEDLQGDPALVVEEADQPSVVLPEADGLAGVGHVRTDKGAGAVVGLEIVPEDPGLHPDAETGEPGHGSVHCPLEDGGVHRLGQDSRKAVDRRVLLPLESGVEDAGVVQPVPVRGTFGRLGHGGASFPL